MSCLVTYTVVAEIITELVRFEPEVCICNGNQFRIKSESIAVMRNSCKHSHRSVSVMEINSSDSTVLYLSLGFLVLRKMSVCNNCGYRSITGHSCEMESQPHNVENSDAARKCKCRCGLLESALHNLGEGGCQFCCNGIHPLSLFLFPPCRLLSAMADRMNLKRPFS